MPLLNERTHRKVYVAVLGIYIIGLVFSKPVLSMATMGLAALWLSEGNLVAKFKRAFTHPISLSFIAIFLIHVIGLAYSHDMDYALNDVRVKLPLFVIPILFTTDRQLERSDLDRLLQLFVLAVFVTSLISFSVYMEWIAVERDISDVRHISLFMSHIRLSLLLCFSVFICAHYWPRVGLVIRAMLLLLIVWFVHMLILLESGTGMAILLLVIVAMLALKVFKKNGVPMRIAAGVGIIAIPLAVFLYLDACIEEYYVVKQEPVNLELPEYTAQGNAYDHDTTNLALENGYYVWRNMSVGEFAHAWNERANVKWGELDERGVLIDGAVIRYVTSKGLRKDAEGIAALTDEDILQIESGIANVADPDKWGFRKRIDQVIFEFDVYLRGGDPSGNSVTQRLEFWRGAWHIIKENPWFGVGTGDVQMEFANAYQELDSALDDAHRLKSHNQFITIAVAFGFVGLAVFVFLILLPLMMIKLRANKLYLALLVTSLVSFLTEDTLEMQVGVSFFVFFSCLMLLGTKKGTPSTSLRN